MNQSSIPSAAFDAQSTGSADRLQPVFSSGLIINGAATTPDGRLFLPVQPEAPDDTHQVVEIRDGKPTAYPDEHWNSWRDGMDGAGRFVGVNAIRIGPDGYLWIVDRGAPGIGKPLATNGVKLVKIDVSTDEVVRVYDLTSLTSPWSFVDDVRFNGSIAYLTDAGKPALIVLDLATGDGRRVLEGHPSTVAQTPLMAEGKVVRDPQDHPVVIHADQLEVSPDGQWFYYQPCSGGLSRIATRFLDDPSLSEAELADRVERFARTPSTGGTAIDAEGTIYLSDTNRKRILTISPEGEVATLIDDPRLAWVDAMWIDDHGYLLMPAAQLNRTAGLNGGTDAVAPPFTLFRILIGHGPVRR